MTWIQEPDRSAEKSERYGFRIVASTLAKYAWSGAGPIYRLAGRAAVYEIPNLDEWAEERLSPPIRRTGELREIA